MLQWQEIIEDQKKKGGGNHKILRSDDECTTERFERPQKGLIIIEKNLSLWFLKVDANLIVHNQSHRMYFNQ